MDRFNNKWIVIAIIVLVMTESFSFSHAGRKQLISNGHQMIYVNAFSPYGESEHNHEESSREQNLGITVYQAGTRGSIRIVSSSTVSGTSIS